MIDDYHHQCNLYLAGYSTLNWLHVLGSLSDYANIFTAIAIQHIITVIMTWPYNIICITNHYRDYLVVIYHRVYKEQYEGKYEPLYKTVLYVTQKR